MAAATRVIALQGLSASTAAIAKEAGVSNGSLFTYFTTKADLLNQLYLDLKSEMGVVAVRGLPIESDPRSQLLQMWRNWLRWAAASPEKHRALAHLGVSEEITAETRQIGGQKLAGVTVLFEKTRQTGPMRDVPLAFVSSLLGSMANATIDFMIADPARADEHCTTAFEALWRVLA